MSARVYWVTPDSSRAPNDQSRSESFCCERLSLPAHENSAPASRSERFNVCMDSLLVADAVDTCEDEAPCDCDYDCDCDCDCD